MYIILQLYLRCLKHAMSFSYWVRAYVDHWLSLLPSLWRLSSNTILSDFHDLSFPFLCLQLSVLCWTLLIFCLYFYNKKFIFITKNIKYRKIHSKKWKHACLLLTFYSNPQKQQTTTNNTISCVFFQIFLMHIECKIICIYYTCLLLLNTNRIKLHMFHKLLFSLTI